MADKKQIVVLLSGGIDSVTGLYSALKTEEVVATLSFNYGSKHNDEEIKMAAYHCQRLGVKHTVVNLTFINDLFQSDLLKSGGEIPEGHYEKQSMKSTVVPFRNGIMLSVAVGYAESVGANAVMIAAHSGDHAIYPDCRNDFMEAISSASRLGTYARIEIIRPFIELNKTKIVQKGSELGIDYAMTYSCYKGGNLHCGKCGTCVERREAFAKAQIEDPTEYESNTN